MKKHETQRAEESVAGLSECMLKAGLRVPCFCTYHQFFVGLLEGSTFVTVDEPAVALHSPKKFQSFCFAFSFDCTVYVGS